MEGHPLARNNRSSADFSCLYCYHSSSVDQLCRIWWRANHGSSIHNIVWPCGRNCDHDAVLSFEFVTSCFKGSQRCRVVSDAPTEHWDNYFQHAWSHISYFRRPIICSLRHRSLCFGIWLYSHVWFFIPRTEESNHQLIFGCDLWQCDGWFWSAVWTHSCRLFLGSAYHRYCTKSEYTISYLGYVLGDSIVARYFR